MRMFRTMWKGVLLLALIAGTAEAADVERNTADTKFALPVIAPKTGWSAAEVNEKLGGSDPIEGFNRCMFAITDFGINYIADPLGRFYASIFPRPFIDALDRACVNLEYPGRAMSCLLVAEWRGAGDESVRFLVNSTLGIGGFFDPAGDWWHFYSTGTDFGQAFAVWGIEPGCTFILPFCPRTNIRDQVGFLFDMAFDGKTYIPFAGYATALNRMVVAHRAYTSAVDGCADKYRTYRELMLLNRELQKKMWFYRKMNSVRALAKSGNPAEGRSFLPPLQKPAGLQGKWVDLPFFQRQSPVQDSLRVAFFRPQRRDDPWFVRLSIFNRDFAEAGKFRSVRLFPDRPKLEFCYWPAPRNLPNPAAAPLVLIVPGISGDCRSETGMALAELFHQKGCAAVVLDNPMAWQFPNASLNCRLPGYTPEDAGYLELYLKKVLDYLRTEQDCTPSKIVLTGYSLGALETLFTAARQIHEPSLGISRYVAVNPPANLAFALEQADKLSAASSKYSLEKTIELLVDAAGQQMFTMGKNYTPFDPAKPNKLDYVPPVTREQAEILAALYFRIGLRGVLLTAHRERGLKQFQTAYSWGGRNKLYREIDRVNFGDYANRFMSAEFKRPFEELNSNAGLYAVEAVLKTHPDIRVLHSYDDFLLSVEDRAFLDRVLQKRITWFSAGAHLGNLYTVPVQQELLKAVLE